MKYLLCDKLQQNILFILSEKPSINASIHWLSPLCSDK